MSRPTRQDPAGKTKTTAQAPVASVGEDTATNDDELRSTDPELAAASVESSEGGGQPTDLEATVNLTGDSDLMRDLVDQSPTDESAAEISRAHLKGLLEALIFASTSPIKHAELAKAASAQAKEVRDLLGELKTEYAARGVQLEEVAGGWIFRTNAVFAPFIRDLSKQKPVRLTRAQVETLAIVAYRQPITRPELDDIRGVDSGPVLKLLLERDLVRILGKKDEPGRPILYGSTNTFLEFFGLKSLKDLPTLKEFTELNEDSRRVVERELGDVLDGSQPAATVAEPATPESGIVEAAFPVEPGTDTERNRETD